MNEKNVNLLRVTPINGDEITLNSIKLSNIDNTQSTLTKQPPVIRVVGENGTAQKDNVEATQEDEAIVQAYLQRKFNNSMDKLSVYALNDEEKKLAKKKIFIKSTTLFNFFSNTSLHALPLIVGNKRSNYRVILWIAIIFISLGLMLWALTAVTMQYAEKNTILYSTHNFNERLRFPAITICNKNLYRKSVAASVNIDVNKVVLLNQLSNNPLFADIFGSNYSYLFNTTDNAAGSVSYFNNSGHQIEQMLFYCRYATSKCTTQSFMQRTSTSGNCYTFNSGENGSTVLYSIEGGFMFGLELILNAEQYEYFLADSDSVGFNMFIHDQGHFPYYGGVNSFSISPGQSTQVALRKVDYKLQTPAGGGQCDDEITLKYFDSYSRLSCIVECVTDVIVSTCDCKGQGMPGPAPVCQLNDLCIQRTIVERLDQERCDCPIACESTIYQKTLSYAKFPADHIALLLNNSNILSSYPFPDFIISNGTDGNGKEYHYLNDNFTESFLSSNFAKVFIYYDELVSTTMEEGLRYTEFQYIADFGGYIGVFTGAGFLTFFEIVDLCYNVIRPIDN